jgi:hypothetical protein
VLREKRKVLRKRKKGKKKKIKQIKNNKMMYIFALHFA